MCKSNFFFFFGCSAKIDADEELEQTIVDDEITYVKEPVKDIVEADGDKIKIPKSVEVNTQSF